MQLNAATLKINLHDYYKDKLIAFYINSCLNDAVQADFSDEEQNFKLLHLTIKDTKSPKEYLTEQMGALYTEIPPEAQKVLSEASEKFVSIRTEVVNMYEEQLKDLEARIDFYSELEVKYGEYNRKMKELRRYNW